MKRTGGVRDRMRGSDKHNGMFVKIKPKYKMTE